MHAATAHPTASPPPSVDPDRTTAPAALLLSSHEMFHQMMAAPWASRPLTRTVSTRCP
ncbi:hypothetical protein [Streptomyces capitiformicae]|uniref:hypothetical protein n=1 Tax=Streptomyces capitiformicae TaxID=2014920 RepID=UPI001671FC6A|nr:hypothetical protein [Streptomyces capitiformicae]